MDGGRYRAYGTFSHVKLYRVMEGMEPTMSDCPRERDYTHPTYWKVPVKPSDNRALTTLLERRRLAKPGERVSAADVIRQAVYEALNGGADDDA
jgi:hypothetical protein